MANQERKIIINYFLKRKEILIFAIVVMFVTTVPYLLGFAFQGDNWRFTGFVIGLEDGNSYIAKMLSGAAGDWLFRSPFSATPQNGVVAFLPYILLGKLTSQPAQHEQLIVLFHIFRFISGVLAILASYDFLSVFIKKRNHQWWSLIMIVFGGGLGWVWVILEQKNFLGSLPLDFISPESFGFLSLMGLPHLAMARALFLWGLTAYLSRPSGITAGILWLLLGFFQPMVVLIAWAVVGSQIFVIVIMRVFGKVEYTGIEKQDLHDQIIKGFQAGLISSPIIIYTTYVFLTDPYLIAWTAQNQLPSPHFVHYLIAYGLVLPFALMGIEKIFSKQFHEGSLLVGWVGLFPFLVYAPVATQRRLAEGIWVVLVIGFFAYFNKHLDLPKYAKSLYLLTLPSTILIFAGSLFRVTSPETPLFRSNKEVETYQYLAENVPINSVVLSSFETGNNLPAWAPMQVVLGHGPETIDLENITETVNLKLNEETGNQACGQLFEELNIAYLIWGPIEKNTWRLEPKNQECLVQIYSNEEYALYRVKK